MSTTIEAQLREGIGTMRGRLDALAQAGPAERAAALARFQADYLPVLARLGEVEDPGVREQLRGTLVDQVSEAQRLGAVPRSPVLGSVASKDDIKWRIYEIIKTPAVVAFATADENGKPWTRYVMAAGDQDLNVAFITAKASRKCAHVATNPKVSLSFRGSTDADVEYVQIEGHAWILADAESKRRAWSPMLWLYAAGPEDPNSVLIAVSPLRAELWNLIDLKRGGSPYVWEP